MKRCIALTVLLAAGSPAAEAGPKDDVVDVLAKCTDLADREARIECYDRAAPQLRAAAGLAPVAAPAPLPPAAQYAPPPPAETPSPPQSQSFLDSLYPFGKETPPKPIPAQMAQQPIGQEILPITIAVTDYDVAPNGSFTVTLENGQVWRERNEHYDTPPFKPGTKNYVTIERGMLGGFNLYLFGYGKIYKVMRIK